ncbi:hypothetical protein [Streptantibioticus ferralitis]|uniref:Uncharacterized protein n=1 Tax=Streptantibioticus ferralitis TaxID=236510 RepID=A0ABT5Z8N9_9ACTN|nr:hypothetical protein [Streptantibioticus ferralitis]MDF2260200.1 hypothetical protein [Streptantibioticus ferralitis]
MTKIISLADDDATPEMNWFATSWLFERIADFVLERVDDERIREDLKRDVLSGYLFIRGIPEPFQERVLKALRDDLPKFVDDVIYPPSVTVNMDNPQEFIDRAKSLSSMAARRLDSRGSQP